MYGDSSVIESWRSMKRKIISSVVYASASFALAVFWEALYGAGPITGHFGLVYLGIAGACLFAFACVLSLFTPRIAVVCALAAGALSWPYFSTQIPTIPWSRVVEILPYANWQFLLTAILGLAVSSVYSLSQLRLVLRGKDLEGRKTGVKLVVAVVYTVGILILENRRSIW
jgi:hypothetical protein